VIYGIGTDLIAVHRIERVFNQYGRRFAERILAPQELIEFDKQKMKTRFLAKRFAAKEAFSKAMGTGIRKPVTWCYIAVGHDKRGKPVIDPHPDLQRRMAQLGIVASHVSITDEQDNAVAFVVLEVA
jgi:holo-[acyl-carrier protein] synthase